MSVIDTLVYDRTQEDVLRVYELRNKILTGGLGTLTPNETTEYFAGMKGAYNATDLNRVGSAVAYLKTRMDQLSADLASLREGGNLLNFADATCLRCELVSGSTADDFTLKVTDDGTALISYPLPDTVAGKTIYFSGESIRTGTYGSVICGQIQRKVGGVTGWQQITNSNYSGNIASFVDAPVAIPSGATEITLRVVVSGSSDHATGGYATMQNLRLRTVAGMNDMDVDNDPLYDMPYDPAEISVTPKTDWSMTDVPTQAQADTYLADITTIRSSVPVPSDTPLVPVSLNQFSFVQANAIERILYVIDETLTELYNDAVANINDARTSYQYAGEAICGRY